MFVARCKIANWVVRLGLSFTLTTDWLGASGPATVGFWDLGMGELCYCLLRFVLTLLPQNAGAGCLTDWKRSSSWIEGVSRCWAYHWVSFQFVQHLSA